MSKYFKHLKKKIVAIPLVALILVGIIYFIFFRTTKSNAEYLTVKRGAVTQEVTITGKTKPIESVNLAFERSGKIVSVRAAVGEQVYAGTVLVQLNSEEAYADLAEAEGGLEAAQAKLDELKHGTRPEDIKIKQTELDKANQDLANEYSNVLAGLNDAFTNADDAVRKQTEDLFTNDEQSNPQLTFVTLDSQAKTDVEFGRFTISAELNKWKNELSNLQGNIAKNDLDKAIINGKTRLLLTRSFLNRLMDTLNASPQSVSSYKTSVNTGLTNVNTAISNVATQEQNISSQKISAKKIEDELQLKLAGSTPETIQAQEAAVKQANAKIQNIQAQITKNILRSPIAGIVTKQDAKIGEIAVANTVLTSVISENNLEIESNVPEIDIGKIQVGNIVHITLDAFPGEKFEGKVTYIDPAETIIDGVVNFKVTINFDQKDTRIKSGLTSNLNIETIRKNDVLILPQFGILENDLGTFVRKMENGNIKETPVTLGIRSQDGQVEIISGVTEGEKVLNIGIKTAD